MEAMRNARKPFFLGYEGNEALGHCSLSLRSLFAFHSRSKYLVVLKKEMSKLRPRIRMQVGAHRQNS